MNFQIGDPKFPIIAVALHDGHKIREELYDNLFISDKDRFREEDPYTGRWLNLSLNKIQTDYSRFEVDLNRPKEKAVYLTPEDSWGLKVWKKPLTEELIDGSYQKYFEFYSRLESELDELLKHHQIIVIYDLHSYNYKRNGPDNPSEPDSQNPELNLGTGTLNRNWWSQIIERFIDDVKDYDFMGRQIDIRENVKFKGGYLSQWVHMKYPNSVCCLSIEFRKFFMDEWTGEPYEKTIEEIGKLLKHTTGGIIEEINNFDDE